MKLLQNKQKQKIYAAPHCGKIFFRYLGMALLVTTTFLFSSACSDSASERADKVGGVTARQVIENPGAYVGKTVTVSGDVEEIHGPRAFNMDSGLSAGELLVIGREPFPQVTEAGNRAYVISDVATVTGTVRMLVAADVEREIGWDLEPQLEAEFNAKPVLIAQNISFRPNANRAATMPADNSANQSAANTANTTTDTNPNQSTANNQMNQTATNANGTQTAETGSIIDAGVYASTADKLSLVGKEARLSNLRVVRVVGPRTFTVPAGSGEMIVMLDEESARGVGTQGKIAAGKTLNLTGRFERLQDEEIKDISNNRFRALTEQERAYLKNTPVFLQADKVSDLNE